MHLPGTLALTGTEGRSLPRGKLEQRPDSRSCSWAAVGTQEIGQRKGQYWPGLSLITCVLIRGPLALAMPPPPSRVTFGVNLLPIGSGAGAGAEVRGEARNLVDMKMGPAIFGICPLKRTDVRRVMKLN